MKEFLLVVFNKQFVTKLISYFIIILLVFVLKSFLILFLLTFLLWYLTFSLAKFLNNLIKNFVNKYIPNQNIKNLINKIFNINIIVSCLYLLFLFFVIFALYKLLPKISEELWEIPQRIPFIKDYIIDYINKIQEFIQINQNIQWQLNKLITDRNIDIIMKIVDSFKKIWDYIVTFVLSFILSYFFVIERNWIYNYLHNYKISFLSEIFFEVKVVFKRIFKRFWMIFKAQSVISFVNTILTIVWLTIISYIHGWHFPYLLTLSSLVFLLWFIPVAWVFISSVPILIVWFVFWGISVVVYSIIMILIIHSIEAYFLNPKIVSSYTKMPMAFTFLILIISEHILWVVWLLIWVPLFFIVIDTLSDIDRWVRKRKRLNNNSI